ncbi:phosphodiester glycosidase family protein [Gloeomargaritales cyanobacterium VI4D9]|nr:phosphodiester glycosidase family protein [Gloeomargaritales cyanobacterium VI4D9]
MIGLIVLAQTPLPPPQPPVWEQRLSVNGETWVGAWRQWRDAQGRVRLAVSEGDATQRLGIELRSSRRPQEQPVVWFSPVQNLSVSWHPQYTRRFLEVTELFAEAGWQTQVQGNELRITAPVAQIQGIRQSSRRMVIDLDKIAPWRVQSNANQTILRILAPGRAELRQSFPNLNFSAQATVLTFSQPMRVTTLPNPPRLVVEPQTGVEKLTIHWAPGLQWRQEQVRGYGVTWLEIDPQQYMMRPVWEGSRGQTGLAPLLTLAQQVQGVAAINGGFFNRNTQLPLGAIRWQGQWYSSPILNRGMVAWNDQGELIFARAQLQEQVRVNQGAPMNLQALNSGYVQKGIARYTANWGATYTPLTQGETVITVTDDRVVGMATGNPTPVPLAGYVLVGRGLGNLSSQFPLGATVQLTQQLIPSTVQDYPHGLGAGPLLLKDGRVVLDPEQEQFQPFFRQQKAPRSALGVSRSGRWLWVTVGGNEAYQQGPTLTELTQIMQDLGAVAALNLDGGTSTSLVLGGQVLVPGGRVHNGLVLLRRS